MIEGDMEVGEPPPSRSVTIDTHTTLEANNTKKVNLYENWHQGPYIVILTNKVGNVSNLHPMRVGKALYGHKDFHITDIKKLGRNRLEIVFTNSISANKFVKSNFSEQLNSNAFIPFHRTSIVGIAKGIPIDFSEEEILQHIKTRENYPVADVYRFKRRVIKEDGMIEWVPTQTLKLTFLSQFLPDRIFIYGATANIEKYIQPIRQCTNCQKFGHIAKFCHQEPVCVNCGESHHEKDCTNPELKCKHCALKHKANDKTCPQYILQTKLINLMSEHNIPFYEAKDIYQGNKTIANIVRHKPTPTLTPTPFLAPPPQSNIGHFPPLTYTPPSNGS